MTEFEFLGKTYQTDRVIGDLGDSANGPTLVFFGGIHGNERTGVVALQRVFEHLRTSQVQLQGRVLGLAGNLPALAANRRCIDLDLNRIWTREQMRTQIADSTHSEHRDRAELSQLIDGILALPGEKYFFDLHTTSSPSVPFIAINDQMANRNFARQFPVQKILGIEEYLEGPLLSYLNDFGHVAFAFEAGQHTDPESVDVHVAFIRLAMLQAGLFPNDKAEDQDRFQSELALLKKVSHQEHGFFEVVHREAIREVDHFEMESGFENFSPIRKRQLLATNRLGEIRSKFRAQIFMPLYQAEGNDGFFVIRRIPGWALWMSRLLRGISLDKFLVCLPGVRWHDQAQQTLIVNKRVAFLLRNQIFHLLGYRRKQDLEGHVLFSRREIIKQ